MKRLFDTHTFLWWTSDPARLSPTARTFCDDPENELWLSVVSLWETQIKCQIGKLSLRRPLREIVDEQMAANSVKLLRIEPFHVFGLDVLPTIHRDPFDRLLIAQAIVENVVLISADHIVQQYSATIIW